MKKFLNKKGQFTIIAALLVSIVLVTAIITTYSIIRNNPIRDRPQILGSIDEMNLAINRILEFVVGYYGSILQVTGNTTYAKSLASDYLQSSLANIALTHPGWSPSFQANNFQVSTSWFSRTSSSEGIVSITYNLTGLGIYGIQYTASAGLRVTVNPSGTSSVLVNVTRDENDPYPNLSKNNFFFYNYSYTEATWKFNTATSVNSVTSGNSTSVYNITVPSGIDPSSYMLQVVDSRGIIVAASTFSRYTYTFTWNQALYSSLSQDTMVVEALQNGTLRWLGQNLHFTTASKPVPPIPVKAFHINQTINGVNREVPFQVEDWGSNYQVPTGLTSNASVFSNRQLFVFLVNGDVDNVTLWWDGRDRANQTSYAFTNRYFTGDDTSAGVLTNGILTLNIANFYITATVGGVSSTARFMRINGITPTYGANLAYIIHHGIVRDIIHQEAEWSGGISGCPNVYSQIVITLPANATYYTYALRTIFVNSAQSRSLNDLSLIQLSGDWITGGRSLTENRTSGGYPVAVETYGGSTNLFYNFSSLSTGWAHHWSECISGSSGAGIMFTDSSNSKLYTFDSIASAKTGALSVTVEQRTGSWTRPTAVYDKCGETSPYVASRAIDGITSGESYWRHNNVDNHWIILDMGKAIDISRIQIYQSSTASERWGQSSGIEVYVSNDPSSWGSAVWIGTLDASGWRQSGAFSKQGRYVKLVSRSTSSSQRLYEVQVQPREIQATIEFNPVERFQASFTYPLDITWYGAVVTFTNEPIYRESDRVGLWVLVEYPPTVSVSSTD